MQARPHFSPRWLLPRLCPFPSQGRWPGPGAGGGSVGVNLEPRPVGIGTDSSLQGLWATRSFRIALWTHESGSAACPPSKSTEMPKGTGSWGPWRQQPCQKRRITHQLFKEHVWGGLRRQASGSSPTTGQARPGCSPRPPLRNSHKNERIYQHGRRTPGGSPKVPSPTTRTLRFG